MNCEIQPFDSIQETNSHSSFDHHPTIPDSYHATRSERNSSLSENSSDISSLSRSITDMDDKKKVSSYVLNHACFWLGLAAGAIRYLLKNGKK